MGTGAHIAGSPLGQIIDSAFARLLTSGCTEGPRTERHGMGRDPFFHSRSLSSPTLTSPKASLGLPVQVKRGLALPTYPPAHSQYWKVLQDAGDGAHHSALPESSSAPGITKQRQLSRKCPFLFHTQISRFV